MYTTKVCITGRHQRLKLGVYPECMNAIDNTLLYPKPYTLCDKSAFHVGPPMRPSNFIKPFEARAQPSQKPPSSCKPGPNAFTACPKNRAWSTLMVPITRNPCTLNPKPLYPKPYLNPKPNNPKPLYPKALSRCLEDPPLLPRKHSAGSRFGV